LEDDTDAVRDLEDDTDPVSDLLPVTVAVALRDDDGDCEAVDEMGLGDSDGAVPTVAVGDWDGAGVDDGVAVDEGVVGSGAAATHTTSCEAPFHTPPARPPEMVVVPAASTAAPHDRTPLLFPVVSSGVLPPPLVFTAVRNRLSCVMANAGCG
jgi:hypothetical protein